MRIVVQVTIAALPTPRIATVLGYLSAVEGGGETVSNLDGTRMQRQVSSL